MQCQCCCFFHLNGISLMFVWILIAKEREKKLNFLSFFIVTLHLFVLQKLTLLQCWPQPNFWVIKIEAECKNDYHKLVCWTIRILFQSKSRQKWVSMVGNYKKSTFKIPKNKKKLSRIAWVYYQEKKYETNHKF